MTQAVDVSLPASRRQEYGLIGGVCIAHFISHYYFMVLPPLLPTRLTWEHFRAVLDQSVMLRALVNSLGVGAITTALALGLCLFGGYGLTSESDQDGKPNKPKD